MVTEYLEGPDIKIQKSNNKSISKATKYLYEEYFSAFDENCHILQSKNGALKTEHTFDPSCKLEKKKRLRTKALQFPKTLVTDKAGVFIIKQNPDTKAVNNPILRRK